MESVLDDLPMLVLFNKSDTTTQKQRDHLKKVVDDMNLHNLVGTYNTVSKRTHGKQFFHDLHKVVDDTLELLPHVAKEAFIASQSISLHRKECLAKQALITSYKEYKHAKTTSKMTDLLKAMMARLSLIWGFPLQATSWESFSKVVTHCISIKEKIKWLIKTSEREPERVHHQKIFCIASGVLWNRLLRSLSMEILYDLIHDGMNEKHIKEEFEKDFKTLENEIMNKKELRVLENNIDNLGIEKTLDMEREVSLSLFVHLRREELHDTEVVYTKN
mmetsp:Transcript_14302/g.15849  ORF Transcript_14302/g.15849 Transcript_14302/m.15849 type:complete len:275 (-) Transcript_14302:68-892(-)